LCLIADHILRIFVSLEIWGTFGNEKKKEQEARRISAVKWTTLLLRIWNVWSSFLGPESNCPLEEFSRVFEFL
jgi:hypothetical protein